MTTQARLLAHVPLAPADQMDKAPSQSAPPSRARVSPEARRRSTALNGSAGGAHVGRLVTCVGARGGAGASVFSAALARSAVTAGLSCLLVDGDPLGPGLDLLLGAEDAPGTRWPDLSLARGSLVAGTLRQGLPVIDGIRVLAWDRTADQVRMLPETLPTVLQAGLAEHDLVVLDLPRSTGGLGDLAQLVDLGLLLVPAEVRAASAAAKIAAQVYHGVRSIGLVVRGPAPTGLTAGSIASVLHLPILAELRPEPGLAASLDRGEPPGLRIRSPLSRASRAILAEMAAFSAH